MTLKDIGKTKISWILIKLKLFYIKLCYQKKVSKWKKILVDPTPDKWLVDGILKSSYELILKKNHNLKMGGFGVGAMEQVVEHLPNTC